MKNFERFYSFVLKLEELFYCIKTGSNLSDNEVFCLLFLGRFSDRF